MSRVVPWRSLPAMLLEQRNETGLSRATIQARRDSSHCSIPSVNITYALAACFGLLMLYIDLFIVIVPFFSTCFPGLSSLQDGSGCPVGAAHRGYSASYPGTPRLLSSYILSTPALLAVWLSSDVPLL